MCGRVAEVVEERRSHRRVPFRGGRRLRVLRRGRRSYRRRVRDCRPLCAARGFAITEVESARRAWVAQDTCCKADVGGDGLCVPWLDAYSRASSMARVITSQCPKLFWIMRCIPQSSSCNGPMCLYSKVPSRPMRNVAGMPIAMNSRSTCFLGSSQTGYVMSCSDIYSRTCCTLSASSTSTPTTTRPFGA